MIATLERSPEREADQEQRPQRKPLPIKVTSLSVVASVALTCVTLAIALSFCRIFPGWAFVRSLVVVTLVMHGYGLFSRWRRWTMFPAALVGLAVLGVVVGLLYYRESHAVVLPTRTIVRAYAKISGYNPRTRENDEGVGVLDALKFWRKTGFNNHRISAFVSLDRHHSLHVKTGVYLFGGVYVGLGLPRSAHGQRIWEVPTHGPTGDGAPDSWGGHVVPVIGYDEHFLTVVTWGRLQRMTWGFWRTYCDEAYAILSQDLMDGHETDAQGLDVPALRRALSALG